MLDSGDAIGSSGKPDRLHVQFSICLSMCATAIAAPTVALSAPAAPPVVVAAAPAHTVVYPETASAASSAGLDTSDAVASSRQTVSQAGSEDAFVMVEDPDAFESALEAALNDTADMQTDGAAPTEAELGV
jgi:hypothetical protein